MQVISTRDSSKSMPALKAILQGIAEDGGLFVPEYFPRLELKQAAEAAEKGYAELAAFVLEKFIDMGMDELRALTKEAYSSFDTEEVVPLAELSADEYVMELYHGPTLAFKDMALQVLPRLISAGLDIHKQDKDVLVLTATSGDTGKAALEGFKDVPRTGIVVFFPVDGVAPMQRLQMVTQDGKNTYVSAVEGNFDDAQTGVKNLFGDAAFRAEVDAAGYSLSSANSINFGRLVPQVAYYVYAYAKLAQEGRIELGEPVNFCVPTGNFGNILAAYYAKRMGIPVGKLICASNKNNVLTDFFQRGSYNADREFFKTMSPSMDILISSNLERLLFEISGREDGTVRQWMDALVSKGGYDVPESARAELETDFYADFCTEEETASAIKRTFAEYGYLIDTHTAVAQCVYEKYVKDTADATPTVVVSTANPYKFTQDVLAAVTGEQEEDAFIAADKLRAATAKAIPAQISELKTKPVLHGGVVAKGDQISAVREFLGKAGV